MKPSQIVEGLWSVGAVDWDRRLFDSLIPLPDGTSYNSYLVRGTEKTALFDAVDPSRTDILLENLKDVPSLDYVVAHHAEQDHGGSFPAVLEKYPAAKLVCSPKAKGILVDHLGLPEEGIVVAADGETALPGRQDPGIRPYSLGSLAGDDVHAPPGRRSASVLRFLPAPTSPNPGCSSRTSARFIPRPSAISPRS